MNAYNEYSTAVYHAMAALERAGFQTDRFEGCTGKIKGDYAAVTFYPSQDDKFILLFVNGKSRYVNMTELNSILTNVN